jgi:hypothetical protein
LTCGIEVARRAHAVAPKITMVDVVLEGEHQEVVMLRDGSVTIDSTWGETDDGRGGGRSWRDVHAALLSTARTEASAICEQMLLLPEAEQRRIWEPLGHSHLLDYLERELGLTPRAALERLRIAKELVVLPQLAEEFADGRRHYSVVRELTRVATPETEEEWLERTRGKSPKQVEEMVSGHQRGDRPDDPTDPDLRLQAVRYEVTPSARAILRQARSVLEVEHGARMTDSEFAVAIGRAVLGGAGDHARPAYQVAVTVCAECERGWQNGAGLQVDLDPATVAVAQCDHEHIGRLDAETPARTVASVSPRMRRQVFARDRSRCTVPGCRSTKHLDVHHIVFQSRGGKHRLSNLTLLCSACHHKLHDGMLAITGSAPDKLVFQSRREIDEEFEEVRPTRRTHEGMANGRAIDDEVRVALITLGFTPREARDAVEETRTHEGTRPVTLEARIREALQAAARARIPR